MRRTAPALAAALLLVVGSACSSGDFDSAFNPGTSGTAVPQPSDPSLSGGASLSAPAPTDPSVGAASGSAPAATSGGKVTSLPGIKLDAPLPTPPGTHNVKESDPENGFSAYDGVSRAQFDAYVASLANFGYVCDKPDTFDGDISITCRAEQPEFQIITVKLASKTSPINPGLFEIHYTG